MIPYLFIVVGGIMIYAGIKKQNPLEVMKQVLTNNVSSGTTPPPDPATQSRGNPANTPLP